jgi:hypothetical protein
MNNQHVGFDQSSPRLRRRAHVPRPTEVAADRFPLRPNDGPVICSEELND